MTQPNKIQTNHIRIAVYILLGLSILLNVYLLWPKKTETEYRQKLQYQIDSLMFEYRQKEIIIEESLIIIDSLNNIKQNPITIIKQANNRAEQEYKIYKSSKPDERIQAWIEMSRK